MKENHLGFLRVQASSAVQFFQRQNCSNKKTTGRYLSFFVGAAGQIRTADLVITNDALYRLSYSSIAASNSFIIIARMLEKSIPKMCLFDISRFARYLKASFCNSSAASGPCIHSSHKKHAPVCTLPQRPVEHQQCLFRAPSFPQPVNAAV